MKFSVEDLLELDDEFLYDYLCENRESYTVSELKQLSKRTYFSSRQTKDEILNNILHDIAVDKVNSYLYPGEKYGYIKLDKVKKSSPLEKINFIKSFGKYLGISELKSLIYDDIKSNPPTYKQLLQDIYIDIQKSSLKGAAHKME